MRNKLLNLSRTKKRLLSLAFDTIVVLACLWSAFYLRLSSVGSSGFLITDHWQTFLLAPVCAIPFYIRMGLYRAVLRYIGSYAMFIVIRASLYATCTWLLMSFMLDINELIPRSVPVLYCLLLIAAMCLTRVTMRSWLLGQKIADIFPLLRAEPKNKRSGTGIPVAIYGAGEAGRQLMYALDRGKEYRPVGFIDNDINLQGCFVAGCCVYLPTNIDTLVNETGAEEILLALPSLSNSKRRSIVENIERYGLPIRTMPGIADIASGRMKLQEIRDIDISDVLGREEVAPDAGLMSQNIAEQVVLVTGAGGSIGAELCRQILASGPKILVLLEHSEYNLYALDQELQASVQKLDIPVNLVPVLGSVNDTRRLMDVMSTYGVNTVYHAAAYKHVPIVEHNLSQGLRNNVLGTLYTAQAAIACGVDQFVLISTDKAVRPANVMGASKRLAEMVLQALSREKKVQFYNPGLFGLPDQPVVNNTRFVMVRFGNVLGSSGSVIPLFREQIRTGGPLTVTHPEITRYFMTIPEASQLVIQAGAMGKGGDVFVLDMGSPVKIIDLAKRMVQLSGLTVKDADSPDGDIEVTLIGLRPGEKLYEELLIGDNVAGTDHSRISRVHEEWLPWSELVAIIAQIQESLHKHRYSLTRELLLRYVNGYRSGYQVVDWLYKSPDSAAREDKVGF